MELPNSIDDLFVSPAVNKRLWEYALAKKTPANILITGKTGVGKTEASEVLMKQRLEAVDISCPRYEKTGEMDYDSSIRQRFTNRWFFRDMAKNMSDEFYTNIDWGSHSYLQIDPKRKARLKDEVLETPFLLLDDLDEMYRYRLIGGAKEDYDRLRITDFLASLKRHSDNGISGYTVIATATCPSVLPKWATSMFDVVHLEPPTAEQILPTARAYLEGKSIRVEDGRLLSMLKRVCDVSDGDVRQIERAINRYKERRNTLSVVN